MKTLELKKLYETKSTEELETIMNTLDKSLNENLEDDEYNKVVHEYNLISRIIRKRSPRTTEPFEIGDYE